jgi:hypothetical protein
MAWPKILEQKLNAIENKLDELLTATREQTQTTPVSVPADAVGPATVETVETVEPKGKPEKEPVKGNAKAGKISPQVNWNS